MMKTEKQAHYFPHNTHETVQIAEKHRVNEERELIVFWFAFWTNGNHLFNNCEN